MKLYATCPSCRRQMSYDSDDPAGPPRPEDICEDCDYAEMVEAAGEVVSPYSEEYPYNALEASERGDY